MNVLIVLALMYVFGALCELFFVGSKWRYNGESWKQSIGYALIWPRGVWKWLNRPSKTHGYFD